MPASGGLYQAGHDARYVCVVCASRLKKASITMRTRVNIYEHMCYVNITMREQSLRLCSPVAGVDNYCSRMFACVVEYLSSVCAASRDLRYDALDFVGVVE